MTTVQNSVTGRLMFRAKGRAKREEVVVDVAVGRVPRIARLMALAIKLNGMLERGEVSSQKELAELAHVTPARLTQILNLCHLAPDIQEEILESQHVLSGKDSICERDLRAVVRESAWDIQRRRWRTLQSHTIVNPIRKASRVQKTNAT